MFLLSAHLELKNFITPVPEYHTGNTLYIQSILYLLILLGILFFQYSLLLFIMYVINIFVVTYRFFISLLLF